MNVEFEKFISSLIPPKVLFEQITFSLNWVKANRIPFLLVTNSKNKSPLNIEPEKLECSLNSRLEKIEVSSKTVL